MKISFAHFYHDSNVRHFYPQTDKRQFDVKRGSLRMDAAPKSMHAWTDFDAIGPVTKEIKIYTNDTTNIKTTVSLRNTYYG